MQGLAAPPGKQLRAEFAVEHPGLVGLGDRRKAKHLPIFLRQHMACEIVFVQPVHDQDDRTAAGVVEPAVEGMVEPVVRRLALDLGERLLGLQRGNISAILSTDSMCEIRFTDRLYLRLRSGPPGLFFCCSERGSPPLFLA